MRTDVQFAAIHKDALWFINFHGKRVWIVPRKSDYVLSVIKPDANELPSGTVSIEVGLPILDGDYTIYDKVKSSLLLDDIK